MMKRYFRLDGYLYQEEGVHFGPLPEGAKEVSEAEYVVYLADIDDKRQAHDQAEQAKDEERRAKRLTAIERLAKRLQLGADEVELLFGVR